MIKLTLKEGVELKTVQSFESFCNFCGEYNKECVRGIRPFRYWVYETELRGGFFRKEAQVITDREWKELDYADICFDCIRQLAELIKKDADDTTKKSD